MGIRLYYLLSVLIVTAFTQCYSQKIEFDVLKQYNKIDSIYFGVRIFSKDSIFLPSECEFFHFGVDINPMFTLFECEVKKRGYFEPVEKIGYDLNSVYFYLADTIKATYYHCESFANSMDFKKGSYYRVRFRVRFDRFNKGMSTFLSKWYYFKT